MMLVGVGSNYPTNSTDVAKLRLRSQRLTLVGAEHVGKSALVDVQCGRKFGATASSTRFVQEDRYTISRIPVDVDTMRRATKRDKGKDKGKSKDAKTSWVVELAQEVVVSDTVGQHESIEFAHRSIQMSKSVFLCFAVDDLMSMLVLYTRRGNYFNTRSDHRPAYFLIGTKKDRLLDPAYVATEMSRVNVAESELNSRGKTRGRDRWAYTSSSNGNGNGNGNESGRDKTDAPSQQQLIGAATVMPYMSRLVDWDAYLSEAWVKHVRPLSQRSSNPTVRDAHMAKDTKTSRDTFIGIDDNNAGNIDSGEGGGNHRDGGGDGFGDVADTSVRSLSDDEFLKMATMYATDGVEWNGIIVYPPMACSVMAGDIALKSKDLAKRVREARCMFFDTFATRALPFTLTDQQYRAAIGFYSMFPVPKDVALDFMHFYNTSTRSDVGEPTETRATDSTNSDDTDDHANSIKELVYTSALLDFATAAAGKKMIDVHYIFNTMISKYMHFEADETDQPARTRKGAISLHHHSSATPSNAARTVSKSKSWCVVL